MAVVSVDLWPVGLRPDPSAQAGLEKLLSPAELARANRFHFTKDRQAYIAAHGALRTILASYLDCGPAEIDFASGTNGKPAVAGIQFNLSHSADLGVVAVTPDRELGVDVELVDPQRANMDVARRFFSPSEVAVLQALPTDLQPAAFFNCWTRKEAYLKAIGLGLSVPLDSFDVSLGPGEPVRLLRGADARWSLHSFTPAPSYLGALAIDGPGDAIVIAFR